MAKPGRSPSCLCGACKTCKDRIRRREYYRANITKEKLRSKLCRINKNMLAAPPVRELNSYELTDLELDRKAAEWLSTR